MAFSDYLTWDRPKLLARLADLTEELSNLFTEIGYTRAAELKAKMDRWLTSHEDSVTGRNHDATYAAATETISLMELEASERALTEEKWFILRVLERPDA